MLDFSGFVDSFMSESVGTFQGMPRIYNEDKGTYSLGYVKVNVAAATPFTRTKVNKMWLSGTTDCEEGDLIRDRVDGKYHLIMSLKAEFSGGSIAYWDGTTYVTNCTATIKRFTGASKNNFGVTTQNAPVILADNVRIMVNPQNFAVSEEPEMVQQTNKIKVAVQAKVGVKEKDRIETSLGDVLIVENIDRSSLSGIWILMCDSDVR